MISISKHPQTRKGPKPRTKLTEKKVNKMIVAALNKADDSYLDVQTSATIAYDPTAASTIQIFAPAQGVAYNNRKGDKVNVESLSMRWVVHNSDLNNNLRLIIFQWLENTATSVPSFAHLVQQVSGSSLDVNAHYNKHNVRRYNILYDKMISTDSVTSVTRSGKVYVRKGFKPIEFNPGAITGTNLIYYMYISDSSLVPHCVQATNFRINFTDI